MRIKNLTENDIKEIAISDSILIQGKKFYEFGRVSDLDIKGKVATAIVGEGNKNDVEITFHESGLDMFCDCAQSGEGCMHIVAILYEILNKGRSAGKKIPKIALKKTEKKTKYFPFDKISFDEVVNNSSKENLLKAFDLLEKNLIKVKSCNEKKIVFEIKDGKKQVVEMKSNTYSWGENSSRECSCSDESFSSGCAHIAAAYLLLVKSANPKSIPADCKEDIMNELNNEKYHSFVCNLDLVDLNRKAKQKEYELFFSLRKGDDDLVLEVKKAKILRGGGYGEKGNVSLNYIKLNYNLFSEDEKRIVDFVFSGLNEETYGDSSKAFKRGFNDRRELEFLENMRDFYTSCPERFFDCEISSAKGVLEFDLSQKQNSDYIFQMNVRIEGEEFDLSSHNVEFVGHDFLWLYIRRKKKKNLFFELKTDYPHVIKELVRSEGLKIPESSFDSFAGERYIKLSKIGNVKLSEAHEIFEEDFILPKPRLYLKDYGNSFCVELKFLYGDHEADYNNDYDIVFQDADKKLLKIKRNKNEEERIAADFLENAVSYHGVFLPKGEPLVWLCDAAKVLIDKGYEIYGMDSLVNHKILNDEAKLDLKVSSGINWFDLKVNISFGKKNVDFEILRDALKKNERFVKLSDGSVGVIPKKWIDKLSGVIGFLGVDDKKNLKASKTQIQLVEAMLDVASERAVDSKYKKMQEKFKSFEGIKEIALPKKLKGELRDYQKAGYNWLHFLKEFGFGGCLADEMGLGKSAQTLALLLSEQERGVKEKSLIVVPTSLIFNWLNEVKKFAPSLKVYVHHGSNRLKCEKKMLEKDVDLVLTSYGTLRRDVEMFSKSFFNYIVLDESSQIKNPFSQVSKCVYGLKSNHRLVLTGTPVENNYLELWSQFSFLNPGLLGGMDYFKSAFMQAENNNTEALKNIINPFLLMRKKNAVAKDLPDKQITTLYCEMDEAQREFYDLWKDKIKNEIEESIAEKGLMQSRFKILQGLTRLRQICNHPKLVDEKFEGESGKFKVLMNQIEEVMAEGHKVLIFSSFVKMLQIFKKYFESRGVDFSYLDGQTRNREEQVNNFQENPDKKAFLISLKAGGFGLNLTAADYVFIVDPWWNPAVEMQAIDRAHRIGQENKVFVYKSITKNSIEEKILALQEKKREMVEQVIASEEGVLKKLEKEDVLELFK